MTIINSRSTIAIRPLRPAARQAGAQPFLCCPGGCLPDRNGGRGASGGRSHSSREGRTAAGIRSGRTCHPGHPPATRPTPLECRKRPDSRCPDWRHGQPGHTGKSHFPATGHNHGIPGKKAVLPPWADLVDGFCPPRRKGYGYGEIVLLPAGWGPLHGDADTTGDAEAIASRPARASRLARGGPVSTGALSTGTVAAGTFSGARRAVDEPSALAESPCPQELVVNTTVKAAKQASKQRSLERTTAAIPPVRAADSSRYRTLFPAAPFLAPTPTLAAADSEAGESYTTSGRTAAGQVFRNPYRLSEKV